MADSSPLPILPPLTVLVVDDNDVNRMYLLHLLRKSGHTPLAAADGGQALALTASQAVDCILMDVQLPDMDGLTVTRAIRDGQCLPANPPDVPILALTAFAMQDDRERCLAAGMDDHVAKPVRGRDLLSAMARVLEGRTGRPAQAAESQAVLDLSEFSRKGSLEFAAELLGLFVELAEPKGRELAEATLRGDVAAASGLAHDLAGMAGPLRAEALGQAMRALMAACQAGDAEACRQSHAQAEAALAAVLDAARAHPLRNA
ncbi:MAG: response regulator (CheY-like domain and winged-helix DNA-binding domain containing protein) [Solidesulfovibrio magneticus str. Maddingley MBC34]|uniref:Response regulator (CheY-like domain and winged-helix DNA-binding domain containing protein) n=1 Tax=Solidesulfovibrio magneticus str. Maddingley MBC34 TaxID=1206767 RepID=K6GQJ0_9BACT|nr:MAG: response regulator (CheY-like domain and winged-helix DNA-binding domain containing protein) [Solidesulfovibrio magneticus str. Maddingley MBC34]